jgi:hypothetical protein
MLTEVKIEDMAEQMRQLLRLKYADPSGLRRLKLFLMGKPRKVIAIKLDRFPPLFMEIRRDGYAVTVGAGPTPDFKVSIPLKDMMGIFMLKLPVRSALRGKVRFWGNPLDGLLLGVFFYVDVGDRQSAYEYIRHYYIED